MSRNNNSSSGGGIGFTSLLAILFIALKLMGYINWPWIWVLSPIWVSFALFVVFVVFIFARRKR